MKVSMSGAKTAPAVASEKTVRLAASGILALGCRKADRSRAARRQAPTSWRKDRVAPSRRARRSRPSDQEASEDRSRSRTDQRRRETPGRRSERHGSFEARPLREWLSFLFCTCALWLPHAPQANRTTPLAETKKALQPHGAGLKIKSTDRPADLAEFGADPQNPFPNGRRATPQASRREAQATREAYRESARPFAPRSLANPPRRDRELRFPQFEACAKAALAKFLSFHWHGARPDARARRRESLPARTREQNNSHSPSRRAKFNCHIRALP